MFEDEERLHVCVLRVGERRHGFDLQQDDHWLTCSCPGFPARAVSCSIQKRNAFVFVDHFLYILFVACAKYHDMQIYKILWYVNQSV